MKATMIFAFVACASTVLAHTAPIPPTPILTTAATAVRKDHIAHAGKPTLTAPEAKRPKRLAQSANGQADGILPSTTVVRRNYYTAQTGESIDSAPRVRIPLRLPRGAGEQAIGGILTTNMGGEEVSGNHVDLLEHPGRPYDNVKDVQWVDTMHPGPEPPEVAKPKPTQTGRWTSTSVVGSATWRFVHEDEVEEFPTFTPSVKKLPPVKTVPDVPLVTSKTGVYTTTQVVGDTTWRFVHLGGGDPFPTFAPPSSSMIRPTKRAYEMPTLDGRSRHAIRIPADIAKCGGGDCDDEEDTEIVTVSVTKTVTVTKTASDTASCKQTGRPASHHAQWNLMPGQAAPHVSLDGRCGPSAGGATCVGSGYGQCCSQWGWCGNESEHCDDAGTFHSPQDQDSDDDDGAWTADSRNDWRIQEHYTSPAHRPWKRQDQLQNSLACRNGYGTRGITQSGTPFIIACQNSADSSSIFMNEAEACAEACKAAGYTACDGKVKLLRNGRCVFEKPENTTEFIDRYGAIFVRIGDDGHAVAPRRHQGERLA